MKRVIISLLVAMFALCICACSNSSDSESSPTSSQNVSVSSSVSSADNLSSGTFSEEAVTPAETSSNTSDAANSKATIDADEFEHTPSTLPELDNESSADTSSTFSIVIGPDDESGWSEIF